MSRRAWDRSPVGKEYYRNYQREWMRTKGKVGNLRRYHQHQSETNIAPKNWGKPWEDPDDLILLSKQYSEVEKCKMLGRTYGAIRRRIVKLNSGAA